MDCVDEGLSEAQKRAKAEKSAIFTEQMKKLEAMAKAGARILQHDNGSVTFRCGCGFSSTMTLNIDHGAPRGHATAKKIPKKYVHLELFQYFFTNPDMYVCRYVSLIVSCLEFSPLH